MRLAMVIAGLVVAGHGWVTNDTNFRRSDGQALSGPPRWNPPPRRDTLAAEFMLCDGPVRSNCVVDGDTFWFRSVKIRIADIDAPEISHPHCQREKKFGELARDRLLTMLDGKTFSLTAGKRDEDRYGRRLRTVWRSGKSLGDQLVREGLARHWNAPDIDWCDGS
nr:thermonuclease family protein [Agrobacterium tumefaciens]